MVSVGKRKVILFCSKYLLITGNKGKKHKISAKESIFFFTKNQIQARLYEIYKKKRTIYETLAHQTTCTND